MVGGMEALQHRQRGGEADARVLRPFEVLAIHAGADGAADFLGERQTERAKWGLGAVGVFGWGEWLWHSVWGRRGDGDDMPGCRNYVKEEATAVGQLTHYRRPRRLARSHVCA